MLSDVSCICFKFGGVEGDCSMQNKIEHMTSFICEICRRKGKKQRNSNQNKPWNSDCKTVCWRIMDEERKQRINALNV